jgi:hypothetical protein
MTSRKTRATVSELAKQAGATTRPTSRLSFLRSFLTRWRSRPVPASGLAIFIGEDVPRDLDDPLSDPKAQVRVGDAIAKRARKRK